MNITFSSGYALIVGVGADLPNTIDDAQGVANILKDPERCAYPTEQVNLLVGENATRQNILQAFDNLANKVDPSSTVIVYFSGHGYRVASQFGEFYYLMPYGYDTSKLNKTAISGAEFTQKLQALSAQKLLVLLDCCRAGGVGDAKAPGAEFSKVPLPEEALVLLSQGQGNVLIASSKETELSYAGKPYSAFTLAILEALCGIGVAKQDGYTRAADLALHARQVVPGRTQNRQHPVLHFEHADNFVLAYYAGGDAKLKALPFTSHPEIEPEPGAWAGKTQHKQTVVQVGNISNVSGGQINIAGRDIRQSGAS